MEARLEPQIKNNEEIKTALKKVDVSIQLADEGYVETLLVYSPLLNE